MKSISKRSLSNKQEIDMDPYSMAILDELLENQYEWSNSDQIVKLTFRAMSDIIQIHGQSLKDIKSVLTTRASKSQLTTGLSLKANVSDISHSIQQISTQIQDRLSYNDLNKILKQYIHRSQMAKALSQRHFQRQKCQDSKSDQQNINSQNKNVELQIIEKRFQQFQRQVAKKISNSVTLNQFQQALNIIDAKANLKQLNDAMQSLVSKQFLSQCLQKKVNKSDFQSLLQAKADNQDLQYIVNSLQSKVNLGTLQKLTQVIENKADKSDIMMMMNQRNSMNKSHHRSMIDDSSQRIQQLKNQFTDSITQIRHQLQSLSSSFRQSLQQSQLTKRVSNISTQFHQSLHLMKLQQTKQVSQIRIQLNQSVANIKSQLKGLNEQINYRNNNKVDTFTRELSNQINLRKRCQQKIYEQIDEVRKKLDELTMKLFEKNQFNVIKNQLTSLIDTKIQKQYVIKTINQAVISITNKFQRDNQTNTLLLQKLQRTYSQAISTNSNDIVKLNKTLSKKQDKFEFAIMDENMRKSRKQVEDCRKTVDKTYQQLQSKLSISQYETDLLQIKKRFDKLFKQLQSKANIKDVCVLADSKPNIDDVNNALKQINQALNQKITQTELQAILKDQAAVNQTLCSQNIVGRWMWQSGDLKAGGLIPWQSQSANTVPEHFFWQKDKTSILILAPGIYQVKACVFNKNSIIHLLVNGQNIDQQKSDQNSNTINNLRGKSMSQGKKKPKGKDVTGNKLQHFVILPARSRISLCCLGEAGQGFLNLKRL